MISSRTDCLTLAPMKRWDVSARTNFISFALVAAAQHRFARTARVIRRAEAAYHAGTAPLNSVEGFIRQILGWREYVYWRYHQMNAGLHEMNHWQAERALPAFFWTGKTDIGIVCATSSAASLKPDTAIVSNG
ncbi:MAG: hypothetical protein IPL01_18315 [Acidobacteria bacterium]|nr:hypothetical protein [Acidobacteriota bacterium]